MKHIDENITSYIHKSIPNIECDRDFWQLLMYIYEETFNERCSIGYYDFMELKKTSSEELYTTFHIKKNSGKDRIINAPSSRLKKIQQCLNIILQAYYKPNDSACGFIPKRSIICGAKQHTNKKYVYNIDLKDFFDYITMARVKIAIEKLLSWSNRVYYLPFHIAKFCCCDKTVERINNYGRIEKVVRSVLPQGAPTSPILTNIVCQDMDRKLMDLARNYNAIYTRYADDITFSCDLNIFDINSDFCCAMRQIIHRDNMFVINKKKSRLQCNCHRQEVTGIIVNQKVNIRRQYVKQLRMWLYLWEQYGLERAQQYFITNYLKEKRHSKKNNVKIENVVGGKLDYLKMVIGSESEMYKKLYSRYKKLCEPRINNQKQADKK